MSRPGVRDGSGQRAPMPLWPLVVLLAGLLLPVDAVARKRTR